MLFSNLDNLEYTIGNKTVTVADIFRNISIIDTTGNAFVDYYIQEGEKPETVSLRFYGSANYSWLIMLCNRLSLRDRDWYLPEDQYNRYKDNTVGGDAIYIANLPEIQSGDIVVKVDGIEGNEVTSVDSTVYRYITDFDKQFRKIRGISGSGDFQTGDLIAIARKNEEGVISPISFGSTAATPVDIEYAQVLFTEKYKDSIEFFYRTVGTNSGGKIEISPYRRMSGNLLLTTRVDSTNTSLDPEDVDANFEDTLLYYYFENLGDMSATAVVGNEQLKVYKETIDNIELNQRSEAQKIKVLKKQYLNSVLLTIESALESDAIGRSFRLVI